MMAKSEAHDEDMMRDAVSLVRRIECQYSPRSQPSLVGVNDLGWIFVYLGADPMYRFDQQGRLRRAFVDGHLFRTGGTTLAMMERHRSTDPNSAIAGSTLVRRDLSPPELNAFRDRMRSELTELCAGLVSGNILRQHPAGTPHLAQEMRTALQTVLESPEFLAPALVRR